MLSLDKKTLQPLLHIPRAILLLILERILLHTFSPFIQQTLKKNEHFISMIFLHAICFQQLNGSPTISQRLAGSP